MSPDYVIFCDGGCTANPGDIAVAAVVCTPDGEVFCESARMAGKGTNNVGEYRALRHAIELANLVGAQSPMFMSDSALVVQQVNRLWAMKAGGELAVQHRYCVDALYRFGHWTLQHVPREKNKRADWLACNLLGHGRTLKNKPKVSMVACVELDSEGRPGWAQMA